MKPSESVPVSEALYHATSEPTLGKTPVFNSGFCGSCHRWLDVANATEILSRTFGSWDSIIPDPRTKRRHLCLYCGWAYRCKELLRHPTIITQGDTTLHHPSSDELRDALRGPIPTDTAVLVPVAGKKVVAPIATWGHITSDHGPITWARPHAQAVKNLLRLRDFGFTEKALAASTPPWAALTKVPDDQWDTVQRLWRELAPLRADKNLFPLLIKLTRTAP